MQFGLSKSQLLKFIAILLPRWDFAKNVVDIGRDVEAVVTEIGGGLQLVVEGEVDAIAPAQFQNWPRHLAVIAQ